MDIVILKSPQITKEDREDKKLSQWMRQQADKWHKKKHAKPIERERDCDFRRTQGNGRF